MTKRPSAGKSIGTLSLRGTWKEVSDEGAVKKESRGKTDKEFLNTKQLWLKITAENPLFFIKNEITSEIIDDISHVFTYNVIYYLYNINSRIRAFCLSYYCQKPALEMQFLCQVPWVSPYHLVDVGE